jgi:signal transduction histidine kinase
MTADALATQGVLPQASGRIQRAAQRMLRLIDDLLDFASIESGRLAVKRQPQDPGSMIEETLAGFEGIAQAKGLQVTADVEPHLPMVYCDRDRVLQVLSNLVGNATAVTADGGHICLRAEARGHEVSFTVEDDGPGLSEVDVQHLFDRYWRSSDAKYKGSGLGLAIARGIVGAHGGRIHAESELGRGARFLFTIPTADLTALFRVPAPDDEQTDTSFPIGLKELHERR